ncbi:MAG: hypothetical protein BGO51_21990 [Rhodospirillales bacterium 69-11]|nr:MAG: hypothetical protein BGO51_21990 [Rhodospirillales bacterium 69-11]
MRQAEERHRQEIEKQLAWFGSAGTSDVPDDFPIASVDAQIQRADEILSSTDWQDRAADAQEAHRKAMERMKTMREHLEARQKEAAEKAAKEAEERAAQKERERIEAEKKAEADAAAKREADKKHRARINNEALGGLVAAGLTEDQGKAVVEAIAKGQIPNVKITY